MSARADDRVAKYSMGMPRRLGVAACLLGDPQLLILDEPVNGLDPAGMREMRDLIAEFVAEGRMVIISSHRLDEVQRTCDAVGDWKAISRTDVAGDLVALIRHLDGGPAVIVGHSLSGRAATIAAATAPEMVASIIGLDPVTRKVPVSLGGHSG
jgi:ABC-2 type transport system ATP-binding protein